MKPSSCPQHTPVQPAGVVGAKVVASTHVEVATQVPVRGS